MTDNNEFTEPTKQLVDEQTASQPTASADMIQILNMAIDNLFADRQFPSEEIENRVGEIQILWNNVQPQLQTNQFLSDQQLVKLKEKLDAFQKFLSDFKNKEIGLEKRAG